MQLVRFCILQKVNWQILVFKKTFIMVFWYFQVVLQILQIKSKQDVIAIPNGCPALLHMLAKVSCLYIFLMIEVSWLNYGSDQSFFFGKLTKFAPKIYFYHCWEIRSFELKLWNNAFLYIILTLKIKHQKLHQIRDIKTFFMQLRNRPGLQ